MVLGVSGKKPLVRQRPQGSPRLSRVWEADGVLDRTRRREADGAKNRNGQAMPMLAINGPVRARAARPGGRALGGLGRVWAGADCLLKKLGPYKIVRVGEGALIRGAFQTKRCAWCVYVAFFRI